MMEIEATREPDEERSKKRSLSMEDLRRSTHGGPMEEAGKASLPP
jgi:hypothetical protein